MQSKIVRGPRGVQMEEVWAAADTVLGLGERPTIERVRQQLGRGSPNTVGPMLDGWYGSLAKRLQSPVDAIEQDDGVQGLALAHQLFNGLRSHKRQGGRLQRGDISQRRQAHG